MKYGKSVARHRSITKDLGKLDSNNFYSFKTFDDKEEKRCGARLKDFQGEMKFVFFPP